MSMKQLNRIILLAAALICALAMTVFAGSWVSDEDGWWWNEGGYDARPRNTWMWCDGNGDGIAECYYFDWAGHCMENAWTPDGYYVNGSGAWEENGVIQTKQTGSGTPAVQQSGYQNSYQQNTGDFTGTWYYVGETPGAYSGKGTLTIYGDGTLNFDCSLLRGRGIWVYPWESQVIPVGGAPYGTQFLTSCNGVLGSAVMESGYLCLLTDEVAFRDYFVR